MGQVPGGHPDWGAYFRKTFDLLEEPKLPKPGAVVAPQSIFGGTGNTFNVALGGTINQYAQPPDQPKKRAT